MRVSEAREHNLHHDPAFGVPAPVAQFWDKIPGASKVKCTLCPRYCVIPEGRTGFCKVRRNIDGTLYALSYGRATHITTEQVETEAVFHFKPNHKILSLGNFGCNLDCMYCQNWQYSQFQYTPAEAVHEYTSDHIVELALKQGIKILSWTYNDPAVWFEFVVDTAKKARAAGLFNLFKSAFYLNLEPVKELCKHMDMLSVSLKSADEDYYEAYCKGSVSPILRNTKYVFDETDCHLEVSHLIVTGLSNNAASYGRVIDFVQEDLDDDVPLHFVEFHPDYRYLDAQRTPYEDVRAARDLALARGVRHAYVGNEFEAEELHTYCPKCKTKLIERYGLNATILDTLKGTHCRKCSEPINIVR